MPHPSPLTDWIALGLLPGLGPIQLRRLLDRYGDPGEIAYRVPISILRPSARTPREKLETLREARRTLARKAEKELRACEAAGIRLVTCRDEAYPAALHEIPDGPPLLYLKGELPEGIPRIAVVGSRQPTAYGKRVATGLASGLAARGIEVVSGGARGIDTCAHRGALAEGGRTVVVLGSGFADPYPAENVELFDEIAKSGAVLTEFGLNMPILPENFPRRNRLISALSAAVVVVEAAARSGSLNTASHALEQGREVLAVPGPVSSTRSQGCHGLIQQGAKLVQNIEDILEELPPIYLSGLPCNGTADPGAAGGPISRGCPKTSAGSWSCWTRSNRSSLTIWPKRSYLVLPGSRPACLVWRSGARLNKYPAGAIFCALSRSP